MRRSRERSSSPGTAGFDSYVGLEHLDPGELAIRRWGAVSSGTTFTSVFRPGQVLFGKRRAYQRKVAVPDFNGVCSSDIYVLESKDEDRLLPAVLPFICQTEAFFRHAVGTSAGSLSPRTNWQYLAAYEFALPPLEEQRRITKLLMRIEAALQALHNAHAALTTLGKSTLLHSFRKLLADPAVNIVPAGKVGEVLLGRQRAPQHEDGPSMRPYLRAANVFDGYIDTSDVKTMNFSSSEYERYSLRDGDVLLVEGNSSREVVGRSAIFQGEAPGACYQNTLLRFRPGPTVSTWYAHQYFRYCVYTGTFATLARQTSIAHLGAQNLAALPMPLPCKSRQIELSRHLSMMDSISPTAADRKESLRKLKTRVSGPFTADAGQTDT